jgi:hypothetical protein
VTVRSEGVGLVLEVAELLDAGTGGALVAAARAARSTNPECVHIDLRALESWTPGGATALLRCHEILGDLPDGLHFRTGRGAGRAALLAAYA